VSGADERGAPAAPACASQNNCKKLAVASLEKERDRLSELEAGLERRREYEKNAMSSLLVNELKLKHKRAELAASQDKLSQLKRALRSERSRRTVRKPDLILPHKFSKVSSILPFYRKSTSPLTFQNFWQTRC
jgi:hypothetical protein